MGTKFNATDSSGLRSSAVYLYDGWMVTVWALGTFTCRVPPAAAPYKGGDPRS
jgi:hypothetical protein